MAKVLVIDDCSEFRDVIKDVLEDIGHTVVLAEGPEKGKELCQEGVGLVLCDLVMPIECDENEYMDDSAMVGVHTIHEIHKLCPTIPVVAISGQMDGQPLCAIQNFGAVDSLAKPFSREDLARVVEGALRRAEYPSAS